MANKIGIVLALDGEKEFTSGMKSAQQSAKLFDQQLKNLEQEYKGSANSIEALTKKQELLEQKQRAYNNELKSAKDGQKNATKNYQEATKQLDKYQDELEEAKKALKDLEQAGDTSSKAYKDQAKAVEQLEKAVQKQSDEQAKASVNVTKWDTAVAKAEGDVNKANAAVEKNAKYVDEASQSADGCAKSIDKMGKEASETASEVDKVSISLGDMVKAKAVDLAGDAVRELGQKAIEAAKYVIEVGSKFEASMSKVEALSGASGAQLDAMSQKAQELGSTTKFSASEVADGFSYMALAGWDAQQSIAAIDGIVDLAAASEMDLAQASDMVTDYLSAFGMEASEAGHMADMMAYAQANSNTSTTQLGEAFQNCAANAHANGQEMDDVVAIMEAFGNQGLKGARAGTVYSAMMRDITQKMKDGKIAIGDASVSVVDSEGNFRDMTEILKDVEAATAGMSESERTAALQSTFTSKSIAGVNMALAEGTDKIASYKESLQNCDGAAANMAGTMQNNLQGAITTMNSAAEGLGIALYNQVSGPLTDAVTFATGLISSITEIINPEKTALEQFIADIETANSQVQQSIEHARSTLEAGEAKAAEITAYGEEISGIMQACEEFNGITLADGTTQITDANGKIVASFGAVNTTVTGTDAILAQFASDGLNTTEIETDASTAEGDIQGISDKATAVSGDLSGFAPDGLNTENISSTSTEAQNMIGYVETKVDNVETRLKEFAKDGIETSKVEEGKTAIVELFDEVGEKVGTVKTDISETGTVEISTDKIGEATNAIVTCFDAPNEAVATFKGNVQDLANGEINLSNISEQFEQVADSVTTTYHITDEFTKVKIDTMVASLGSAVQGLADAWDSSTGSLTANRTELEDWFDTAKQVAMYNALQDAINEMYTAWGDAAVNVAKANSAVTAAQQAYDEAVAKNEQSIVDLYGEVREGTMVFGEYEGEVETAKAALDAATEAQADANATLADAETELQNNADALNDLKDVIDDSTVAQEDNNRATEEAIELSEEQVASKEAEYAAVKKTTDAYREASQAITDAFDSAKEAAKSAFDINPFEAWTVNAEQGLAEMQDAFTQQITNMANYSANLQEVTKHVGQEITPEFLQYLQDLGEGGAQVMQDLADAFRDGGDPSVVEEVMKAYTDAMDKQDEIANTMALNTVAYKLGLKEFASTPEDWKGLDAAVEYVQEFGNTVTETTLSAFQQAEREAQACGVAIPEGLKEGIESAKDDPEGAIEAATNQLQSAIQGHIDSVAKAAEAAGITIPDELASGIEAGGTDAVNAYAQLIDLIATGPETQGAMSTASETGQQLGTSVAEGEAEAQGEVEASAEALVEGASTSMMAAQGSMSDAGMNVASSFAKGIKFMQTAADNAGKALADGAKANAENQAIFDTAGQFDGAAFANGILAQTGSASAAGASLAESGKSGASSVGGWDSVGSSMAAGVAVGIRAKAAEVAAEAAAMVRNAIAAARAEEQAASPAKKTRDFIGKPFGQGVAKGIKVTTKEVSAEATHQINTTIATAQKLIKKQEKKMKKMGGDMSTYISQGWLAAGEKLANNRFGIADYTTKKKSDGSTEKETKATETYWSEIFSAAQKYLNNISTVYDVSAKQEKQYWTNVRKHLKKGTQAWYDATKQINQAKEKIKEANKQAKEDEKEAAEKRVQAQKEASEKILSDAEKYVDATGMTTQQEIAYWNETIKTLKEGSDEYETVMKKLRDLKAQVGTVSVAEDLLSTYQVYFNMGEKAVRDYWDTVRKKYKEGTAERVKADKNYLDAYAAYEEKKKQLDDEMAEIEKDRLEDIAEFEKNQIEKIADIEKRAREQKLSAEKKLAKSIEDVNKKLAQDIEKTQKKAIEDRTKSLVNAFSLFDEFESKSVSGQQLLFNMQSQAAGYKDWQETINALSNRGILSQDIISQLLEAGPQQSAAVHALNMLSDKELEAYQKAYDEKMLIASQQAAEDAELLAGTTEEISRLQKEANDRIVELKEDHLESLAEIDADMADEIAELKADTAASIEKRNQEAKRQTAELKASQATERELLDRDINADFLALAQNIQKYASDQTSALVNGLKDATGLKPGATTTGTTTTPVQAAVTPKTTTTAATSTATASKTTTATTSTKTAAQLAAEAEAKSRAVAAANAELVRQAELQEQALKNNIKSIIATGKSRSKTLTDADKASHVALWEHIVSKYGRTPTTAMYKALAQALGVKVSSTPTSTQKNNILKALKSHGMASGTRYLNDAFAWMDENGIGSEMIVRRSDSARLNTNVQRGDAIIPAVNTQNLWEWSKLVPQDFVKVASEASMNARVMGGGSVIQRDTNMMTGMMEDMFILMQRYMPYIATNRTLSVDGRQLAQATSDYTSNIFAMNSRRRR